jgi:hypothetical protein
MHFDKGNNIDEDFNIFEHRNIPGEGREGSDEKVYTVENVGSISVLRRI